MKHFPTLAIAFAALLCAPSARAQQTQQKPTAKAQAAAANRAVKLPGAKSALSNFPKSPIQSRGLGSGSQNLVVGGSDSCATPTVIAGQGAFPFDNLLATSGAEGQNEYLCYQFATSAIDNDVWYVWTADATGTALVESCGGTTIDSRLAIYPSTGACPTAGTSIACNDDACALQSGVTFPVINATDYLVQFGNYPGKPPGTGTLNFSIGGPATNDDCTTPSAIAGQGQFPYNLFGATTGTAGQTEYACVNFGTSAVDNDVWFEWTPDATGTAIVSMCGLANHDTMLLAYPATPGACPALDTAIACNDDACGLQSSINFACVSGQPMLLQIGCFAGSPAGAGSFDITIGTSATNDDCANAIAIAGQGTFPWTNLGASMGAEGQNEAICYQFGSSNIENDVWFRWTADATGQAIISTCAGAANDTKLAAHSAPAVGSCVAPGSGLACNDDACALQSTITFAVTMGTDYVLQLGSYPGSASFGFGTFDITIGGGGGAGGDACSAPILIAGQGNFSWDSTFATTGPEAQTEPACITHNNYGPGVANDVWYEWTADATGYATVSTVNNTAIDTKIAAYAGTSCPTVGSALICNDDNLGTFQSMIQFAVTSGNQYMLQMGCWQNATGGIGTFDVSINTTPTLGDNCDNAIAITGPASIIADTSTATTGGFGQEEDLCALFAINEFTDDLWYEWTAHASGLAHVLTCNTGGSDSKLGVYPGGSCPLPQTSIACDDDTCAFLTEVTFDATAGQQYLIQVGNYAFAAPGTFTVDLYVESSLAATPFCFGDGGGTVCPCGNAGNVGRGCANGADATGCELTLSGSGSIALADTILSSEGLDPSQPGLYFQGNNAINGGSGIQFGDGLRCAGGGVIRLQVRFADPSGTSATSIDIATKGGATPGDVKRYQVWYRNPNTSPCGSGFNLSNGIELVWSA